MTKYLLLIRDIKDAPNTYTKLSHWRESIIYYGYVETEFKSIRYYETNELQCVMLEIFKEQVHNTLLRVTNLENLFSHFVIFDSNEVPSGNSYGEWIAQLLYLEYEEKFEKLSKPIKE